MKADIFNSKNMLRGEVRQKGIQLSRSDGKVIAIESATYQIFDTRGKSVTEVLPATIIDDKIVADIEAGDEAGGRYVLFTYKVDAWTGKAKLIYSVY